MKLKVKITTGFRPDQAYSIPAEEAHKAYYLFLNPDARTVFSTGLALQGVEIKHIEPDYQGTMDWNPLYPLSIEDYNDIMNKGVDVKLRNILNAAQQIGKLGRQEDLLLPLHDVLEKYPELIPPDTKRIGGMQRIEIPHD